MIKTGTIVKGIAGFYYVDTGEKVYECKARGAFKNAKLKPAVGDIADIDIARVPFSMDDLHFGKSSALR